MSNNKLKSVESSKNQLPEEKSPRLKAKDVLAQWEREFREGRSSLKTLDDANQASAELKSLVRAMSGNNYVLCERKLQELSNRIEDATIEEMYPDALLNHIVQKLRKAAECERDPQWTAPWSDHLADLAWKSRLTRLAQFLWSKNPKALDEWSVDLADVKLAVWYSEDAKTNTVKTNAYRLKSFLKERGFKINIHVSDRKDAPGRVKTTIN